MFSIGLTQMMFPWFGGYGYFPYGGFLMFIFWIIIIYLVFRLLRQPYRDGSIPPHYDSGHPPPGLNPLDILKERYAKGEIDKAEYEERKKVLMEK